jgi:hypothetical protein
MFAMGLFASMSQHYTKPIKLVGLAQKLSFRNVTCFHDDIAGKLSIWH